MPAPMFIRAMERQQAKAYPTFSDYIQDLVRRDTQPEAEQPAHQHVA